jgi:ankyrin repeat protein
MRQLSIKPLLLLTFVLLFPMPACHSHSAQALIDASAEGDTRRVEDPLNRGANIEAHARDDWTPLTIAAREGHYETVKLLLNKGAKVNAKEGGGHTPLFWAKKYNRQQVIELLKRAGSKDE